MQCAAREATNCFHTGCDASDAILDIVTSQYGIPGLFHHFLCHWHSVDH